MSGSSNMKERGNCEIHAFLDERIHFLPEERKKGRGGEEQ